MEEALLELEQVEEVVGARSKLIEGERSATGWNYSDLSPADPKGDVCGGIRIAGSVLAKYVEGDV